MDSSSGTIEADMNLLGFLNTAGYRSFINNLPVNRRDVVIATVTIPIPGVDPLSFVESLKRKNDFNFYWEHPEERLGLGGCGELWTVKENGPERFQKIARRTARIQQESLHYSPVTHSLAGIHFLGGFSFFDDTPTAPWQHFDAASFTVPRRLVVKDGDRGLLTIAAKLEPGDDGQVADRLIRKEFEQMEQVIDLLRDSTFHPGLPDRTASKQPVNDVRPPESERQQWIQSVNTAKRLIRNKAFEKVVLARQLVAEKAKTISETHLLHLLRNDYPSCFSFLIQYPGGASFIGSSPERLVSFRQQLISTEGLAGSASRGKTATEDTALGRQLLNSAKNLAEHNFVVEAIERYLSPIVHQINRPSIPGVKKLKNVQHLFTPITARLKEHVERLAILDGLHPTPAVGGHPREKAVPYIPQLEQFERGWYAGPVGWINNQCGEFSVAIRSALIEGETARFFAGCGIVEDSDAETEWSETNLKLIPMLSALNHDN